MKNLIRIFILILLFTCEIKANEPKSNKIIFKINNKIFTNIDIERRENYIGYLNNIDISKIAESEKKELINDYISSLIFYEYSIENKIFLDKEKSKIDNFYNKNILVKLKDKKLFPKEISNIKKNIKKDLIRKKIIESFLNSEKNKINKKTEILDLIYNYNLSYIIVNQNNINKNLINKINNENDFIKLKKYLIKNNIDFLFKSEDINDNTLLTKDIKENLRFNNKVTITSNNNFFTLRYIDKTLESYEGIFVSLVNLVTEKKINKQSLNCEYINNINKKTEFKEYEYTKLNNEIKNNLKSVNDYILYESDNNYRYIFLCKLRYDEKILNNLNLNKKIYTLAESLQNKFINKYKIKYNFMKY